MTTQAPPWIDYTNKDYASLLDAMLNLAQQRLPEWTDQSDNDVGMMLLQLVAYMGDTLFYDHDRIAAESFLETAQERRSVLQMLRLIGYELRPPVPSSADLTLLFQYQQFPTTNPPASDVVTIPAGTQFATTSTATTPPVNFSYGGPDLAIDLAHLPAYQIDANNKLTPFSGGRADSSTFLVFGPLTADDTSGATGDGLPVTQVDATVSNEVVGSSDGTAGQTFTLARTPLIDGSLQVIVNEGTAAAWTEVASLLDSQPTDTTYTVRRDENDVAWLQFGDFTYGRPPRRGRNNITASYKVGGGAKGNVPAGAIAKVVQPIAQLKRVLNVGAASGGADAESNADAVSRGPQQFRSMGRAVTASDYVQHAKTFGVAKVQAEAIGWNVVQLVVAPAGGGYPSLTLQKDLIAYFDDKRMLTTQIRIKDPAYIDIVIAGQLTVMPQYFNDQVQNNAVQACQQLWSFNNVDFGATLFLSKVYEVIEELDGVESVFITTFNRRDNLAIAQIADAGAIRLGTHELPNLSVTLTPISGLGNG
jgi:uncharacterized phage protein gp47/JayE